jgi:hypothetical protein
MADMQVIKYNTDGTPGIYLTGSGYALRCASYIADENYPDARWALEVLTRYGHLVAHESDKLSVPKGRIIARVHVGKALEPVT